MPKKKTKNRSKRIDLFISVAFVATIVVVLGIFLFAIASFNLMGNGSVAKTGASSYTFPLITVWAAVLIPPLVKSKRVTTYKQKRQLTIALSVMVLLVILSALFLVSPQLG